LTYNDDFVPFKFGFTALVEEKFMVRVPGMAKTVWLGEAKLMFDFRPNVLSDGKLSFANKDEFLEFVNRAR
jgi:hypothetical protein